MADPASIPDVAAGIGIGGLAGLVAREVFRTARDWIAARRTARSDNATAHATEVQADLSLASGWKEYAERQEAKNIRLDERIAALEAALASGLARERALEADLALSRARVAQLEARVAELERAAAALQPPNRAGDA